MLNLLVFQEFVLVLEKLKLIGAKLLADINQPRSHVHAANTVTALILIYFKKSAFFCQEIVKSKKAGRLIC
jgi:hypothetical protein